MKVKRIAVSVFLVLLLTLLLSNLHPVFLRFLIWEFRAPAVAVILVSLLCGALVGCFFYLTWTRRRRRKEAGNDRRVETVVDGKKE